MPHVLIVGAGITGLLIAQGLKKAGITYTIFDAETPEVSRRREWTLIIHRSMPYLEELLPPELFARLHQAQPDPTYRRANETIELRNSGTGDLLKEILVPGMKRISRKKLRSLCGEGIDVQWGKTLVDVTIDDVEDVVTAHFADGSTYQGDVLIGADGPKSKVREMLLGIEKARSSPVGINYNTAIVKYGDAEKSKYIRSFHPVALLGYNPTGRFHFISRQLKMCLIFQLMASWFGRADESMSNEQRIAVMKEAAKDLGEPFRSANLWMPDNTVVFNDKMIFWVPIPWESNQGRMKLAGDAAHPLPPHRGQGLNHSILDASNFVDALKRIQTTNGNREREMAIYDEELIKRGAEEVKLSVKTTHTVHNWAELMESPLVKHGVTKMS